MVAVLVEIDDVCFHGNFVMGHSEHYKKGLLVMNGDAPLKFAKDMSQQRNDTCFQQHLSLK